MKRSQRLPLRGRATATELHSKPQPGFSGHKNDILGLTVSLGLQITPICRVKWGRQNTPGGGSEERPCRPGSDSQGVSRPRGAGFGFGSTPVPGEGSLAEILLCLPQCRHQRLIEIIWSFKITRFGGTSSRKTSGKLWL